MFNDELHNLVYNADASHLLQHYPVEVFLVDSKEEIIECVKNAVKEGKKIVCR
ncbi:hypothetical protein IJU97_03085 [bacterium]|nr:hypothetical protein [bacterium]